MPDDEPDGEPRRTYEERLARHRALRDRATRRSRLISNARLVTFVGAAICLAVGLGGGPSWGFVGTAVGLAVGFLVFVVVHDRVIRKERRLGRLCTVAEQALLRLDHSWDLLPVPESSRASGPGLADDLDLFGRASLLQLLGSARTPVGRATLSRWLLEPAPAAEIASRQAAVRELVSAAELRESFEATAIELEKSPPDATPFFDWAEGEPWLAKKRWLLWAARLLPLATVALAALHFAGLLAPHPIGLTAAATLAIAYAHARAIHEVFGRAGARGEQVAPYVALLRMVSSAELRSERLVALQRALEVDGRPAHLEMRTFARIMELADLRHSGMFYLPVSALTLWDVHVLDLLERWQARAGRHVRGWLEAIGELEALSALARLRFDEPGFCFPEVGEADAFEAEGLGHPLIRSDRRVANDLVVGPPGTFLLVTGSNMSGKSTLLRSVGLAAVLAQAGGPVCAHRLRMPEVVLGTSVRVRDSLAEGTSFFMAEVRRIKEVVDLAARTREARRARLLFLLDEVLQGTNSAERRVAVSGLVRSLLDDGALGAISTHDLSLAGIRALEAAARPVHFTETIREEDGRPEMSFDYVLRPGVATSTNALKLLAMVGVTIAEPIDEPTGEAR